MDYLLRGILIGIVFGLPAGAVGALTVQRTLHHGAKAGLFTGLGSSVADCLYACVGVFGLTLISDFMLRYQTVINLLGGTLILLMGLRLLMKKGGVEEYQTSVVGIVPMFLSSFMVGITNPAAVLTFLFAFSYFGVSKEAGITQGTLLVLGVFCGTYAWWGALTAFTVFIRKRMKRFRFCYMNRIFGAILCLFGTVVFVRLVL